MTMGIIFGIGFFILLLIHEIGHILALKKKGFGIRLPFFIPFVGAAIFGPKMEERDTEAYVGYGGPLIGTAAALLVALPTFFTESKIWLTLSFVGIILNLFNMIPISPLDGGRITQAVHSKFKYVGIVMLLAFTALLGEPGLLIVWMAVVIDFDTIRMKKRMYMLLGIWILMASLTFAGVGENYVGNVADTIVGILLALPATFHLFGGKGAERERELEELEESLRDKRPECAPKLRFKWFMAWIGLIILQVGTIILMVPFLGK